MNYDYELKLCQDFLKEDQRNFHCWNYRRFLIRHGEISPLKELQFTEKKIRENFSNYSAFHQRSVFLSASTEPIEELAHNEFAFVENAVFSEPNDQSAWWYHQFILSFTFNEITKLMKSEDKEKIPSKLKWYCVTLYQQLDLMEMLLGTAEKCRWVMTCLVSILQRIIQLPELFKGFDVSFTTEELETFNLPKLSDASLAKFSPAEPVKHLNEYLVTLCKVDELRTNRYLHMMIK